jgi:hypothetical protein
VTCDEALTAGKYIYVKKMNVYKKNIKIIHKTSGRGAHRAEQGLQQQLVTSSGGGVSAVY